MRTEHSEYRKRIDLFDDQDKHVGEIEYMYGGNNTLFATHTEVFPGGEGKGYATQLVDALVDYAKSRDSKIVPVCGFVKACFARHPEKYGPVIGR